jgi:beta-phosphoglucomutase
MSIEGVLWDMDGVMVDNGELHYQAWKAALSQYDIPFARDLFTHTFGMNNWSTLTCLLGHAPDPDFYKKVCEQKEQLFRQNTHGQVKALPGVIELIHLIQARGLRQAISSSAPQENIDAIVEELKLREFFTAIVSGNKMNGKPAPDVFLAAALAIGVPAQNCLVIEDAVVGVEGAKQAGMMCLAVTNTNTRAALCKADAVVDSLLLVDADFLEDLLAKAP